MSPIATLPQELLDLILQYLDIKTLLFAQQVSHHWRETIQTSPQLQENLFLRPKTSPIIHYAADWNPDGSLSQFAPITPGAAKPPNIWTRQEFTSIEINPLLANEIYYCSLSSAPKRCGQRLVLPPLGTFLSHPAGTWHTMLLTQPPISHIVAVSVEADGMRLMCDIDFSEENCSLGGLVGRMLEAEELDGASEEAAERIWHVMYVDAVELGVVALGDWIVDVREERMLVPTGRRYSALSLERVVHPQTPVFGRGQGDREGVDGFD